MTIFIFQTRFRASLLSSCELFMEVVLTTTVHSAIVTNTNICVGVCEYSSYCNSSSSSRTSTCSNLCWSSRAIPSQPSCSPRSSSSHRRHRASRVSPISSQPPPISPCLHKSSLSDCLILNRSPASPEPSNSTTSKPSQPPADPAKHHTCHTGQGNHVHTLHSVKRDLHYPLYFFVVFCFTLAFLVRH